MKPLHCLIGAIALLLPGVAMGQPGPKQPAAKPPVIDHVAAVARPAHYDGKCPASIEFDGTIVLHSPATVSYRWERSDRATSHVETARMSGGSRLVTTTWKFSRPPGRAFHAAETLHVLSPVNVRSSPAEVTLVCR